MKTYVIVTGVLFAAVFVAHILRILAEGPSLLLNPLWDSLTALVLAMFVWSLVVLRRLGRS
jgi:hypothetical protein